MRQFSLLSLLVLFSIVDAFHFYLTGGERKCFYKELSQGTLLIGKYDVEVFDQNTESFQRATQKQLGVIIDVEVSCS
jgi:hypothetical protein